MRYGWILYTEAESIRNREYIQMYVKHGRAFGLEIKLVIYKPELHGQEQPLENLQEVLEKDRPAFAINRTRDYKLAQKLEQNGIRVFNHSIIAELGNDKGKAYEFMDAHGIPVLPFKTTNIDMKDLEQDIDIPMPECYPAVAKSCGGHGGREVYFFRNEQEWIEWRSAAAGDYVIQQAASELGKDLRVYVVNNQIVRAVLRTSNADFRSNFSLGGKAVLYEMSMEERRLAERILSLPGIEIDMAAVDFLFDHGGMVFNELEDMAGARMLYSLTDYDIVREYVEHIARTVA